METKDKILIVEDDETIAAFLIAVLEANGFDTIRASLGREAVTLISSHCPDLVLLDLSLPDMDTAWRSLRGSASGLRCR